MSGSNEDEMSDDDEAPYIPADDSRRQLDEFWARDAFGLRKYMVNSRPVTPFEAKDPLPARKTLAQVLRPEPGWCIEAGKARRAADHDDIYDSVKKYEKSSPYCLATCPVTGLSALHAACLNGYLDLVKAFIELGKMDPLCVADSLNIYFDGATEKARGADALWISRRRGHTHVVEYLLTIDEVQKSAGQVLLTGQAGKDARLKLEAKRREKFLDQADGMGKRVEQRRDAERDRGSKIVVGSRVRVAKTNVEAWVRFVGPVDYASGTFVGLEFDAPGPDSIAYGKHSGVVKGREYFDCPEKRGLMVQPSEVEAADLPALDKLPHARTAAIAYLCDKKGLKQGPKKAYVAPPRPAPPPKAKTEIQKLSKRQNASFERFKAEEESRRRASVG